VRWDSRLKHRLKELGWTAADLNREIGGDKHSYDLIRKYLKGSVAHPRGDMRERIAAAVKMTPAELVFGDENESRGYDPPQRAAEVGMQENPGNSDNEGLLLIASTLPSEISTVFRALSRGHKTELWKLSTDCIEGYGYLPGDLLVVDINPNPAPGYLVLATIRDGPPQSVFRIHEPPYLIASSKQRLHRKPILVEPPKVNLRGAIIASLRLGATFLNR
jgi:transcriptional regulator with XRE-family HTH domain